MLDNTLSNYVSPTYVIDFFPTRRDGKNRASYIIASMYNTLASSIIATEQRVHTSASGFTASLPITLNFYAHSSGALDYRNPNFGNTGEPPYLTLSTTASRNSTLVSGSKITELFMGYKRYTSSVTDNITEGSYERKNSMLSDYGPAALTSLLIKSGESYRDVLFNNSVMKPTPFPATGEWYNKSTSLVYTVPRCIIGSSRASVLATQNRLNSQVYQGFIPTGSTGVVNSAKTVLGPGALMIGGTFWIPPYSENPNVDNVNSIVRNRFACYPQANSGPYYAKIQPMNFYAHVLVIGAGV